MFSGLAKSKVERALQTRRYYHEFISKNLSRSEYSAALRNDEQNLLANYDLTLDMIRFALRYPRSEECIVDECLLRLYDNGLLPTWHYDKAAFSAFDTEMSQKFDHGSHITYIYPEEARLVFALSDILKPKMAVTLGSFYGFWAFWSLPAIKAAGGKMWLVDTNPQACEIAFRNLNRMGLRDVAEVCIDDAVAFLEKRNLKFDFVLLDAEGASDDPRPSYRDKAIYGPILNALVDLLNPCSKLVCHNILTEAPTLDDQYLAVRAAKYGHAYAGFYAAVQNVFRVRVELETTEGVGVYGNSR